MYFLIYCMCYKPSIVKTISMLIYTDTKQLQYLTNLNNFVENMRKVLEVILFKDFTTYISTMIIKTAFLITQN